MPTLLRILNPLLMILIGLGVGVIVARRARDPWRLYAAGAWTFILSQVLHIPFNGYVLGPWLAERLPDGPAPGAGLVLFAVALGLSAGVFEEVARWAAFRVAVPVRRWGEALALGAGHGGVEAVLLGVLVLYQVLQLVAVRGADAGLLLEPGQLEALGRQGAQVAAFWAAPWYAVLLGAVERLFAVCFHLSASVLVLQAYRRGGGLLWVAAAVGWHAILDAGAVYTASAWGAYWAEAFLALMALLSLAIVLGLREPPAPPEEPPAPAPALELERLPGDVRADQIEDSRYG